VKSPFNTRFVGPLAVGATLNPINSTMISVALVPIAATYGVSAAAAAWLIASLYLSSAVAQPTMGKLAGIFGPRKIYLISLTIVAIAGLGGALAPTFAMVVASRALLGIGTSGSYPAALMILRLQAERHDRPIPRLAMAVLSMTALSVAAMGPLLGGVLTSAFGWHSVFTANIFVALFTMALILCWVPHDKALLTEPTGSVNDVDFIGIAIFAVMLLSIMLFLMDLTHPMWTAIPIAIGAGAILFRHSMRHEQPFIPIRMLIRNHPLVKSYIRIGLSVMTPYCILFGFPQWLVGAAGVDEAKAGFITLPMSTIAIVSALSAAKFRHLKYVFVFACLSSVIGCVLFLLIDSSTPLWLVAMAALFFGPALGSVSTATQAVIYLQTETGEMGTALGLQRTAQYIGATMSASLIGLSFGQQISDHGIHMLALISGGATLLLLGWIIIDKTIPVIPE
jgi:MFS family permease